MALFLTSTLDRIWWLKTIARRQASLAAALQALWPYPGETRKNKQDGLGVCVCVWPLDLLFILHHMYQFGSVARGLKRFLHESEFTGYPIPYNRQPLINLPEAPWPCSSPTPFGQTLHLPPRAWEVESNCHWGRMDTSHLW